MFAPRPKSRPLASAIASSRSLTGTIGATGPKSLFAEQIGRGVNPGQHTGLEVMALPESGISSTGEQFGSPATASSTWPSALPRWVAETIGPRSVADSSGSPITSDLVCSTKALTYFVEDRLHHVEALG